MKLPGLLSSSILMVVFLVLNSCETSTESKNEPPVITSLTANPDTVAVEGISILTCLATDSDGDNLMYTWETTEGSISGTGSIVTWTAPSSEGSYSISCKVVDGKGGQGTESINITVTANEPPVILSLTIDSDSIEVGGTTTLTCVAEDPDGDILTYTWNVNSGTINGSGSSVTWTAPNSVGSSSLSCTVEDGNGGQDEESVNISIYEPIIINGSIRVNMTFVNATKQQMSIMYLLLWEGPGWSSVGNYIDSDEIAGLYAIEISGTKWHTFTDLDAGTYYCSIEENMQSGSWIPRGYYNADAPNTTSTSTPTGIVINANNPDHEVSMRISD